MEFFNCTSSPRFVSWTYSLQPFPLTYSKRHPCPRCSQLTRPFTMFESYISHNFPSSPFRLLESSHTSLTKDFLHLNYLFPWLFHFLKDSFFYIYRQRKHNRRKPYNTNNQKSQQLIPPQKSLKTTKKTPFLSNLCFVVKPKIQPIEGNKKRKGQNQA